MRLADHARPLACSVLTLIAAASLGAQTAPVDGNPARGKTLFLQTCALCHTTTPDGASGQGPNLAGVVGRRAASSPTFGYTPALTESGLTWDRANLDRFLANPTGTVPGTNMQTAVLEARDRADLIAYLASLGSAATAPQQQKPLAAPRQPTAPLDADWRHNAPGVRHHITVDQLPKPYATRSAGNGPRTAPKPADSALSAPKGFTVSALATGLSGPRLLRVAPNGDIFVAETRANRLRILRAADGSDAPTENTVFADGLDRPFGIAFYPAGDHPRWLYVANNNQVVRFAYRAGDLKASGKPEVVIPKLSEGGGGHSTRDIAFSNDGKRMFISVGSASNVAEGISRKTPEEIREWETQHGRGAAWDSETNRALILVTDPEGKQPLRTFATGIRNGVGITVDPKTGDLWTSNNERDGLGDDLVPDYITRVKEGGYYGWPWYYLGNHEEPRHAGERPDLAGQAIVPDVLIQAHSAALQIVIYPESTGPAAFPADYHGEIFAALHGSWNREPRTGYKVVRVFRKNGVATGDYEDFLTGFVIDDRSVWGRPVGVAVAKDGALLVTDDASNTVWRVAYSGGAK